MFSHFQIKNEIHQIRHCFCDQTLANSLIQTSTTRAIWSFNEYRDNLSVIWIHGSNLWEDWFITLPLKNWSEPELISADETTIPTRANRYPVILYLSLVSRMTKMNKMLSWEGSFFHLAHIGSNISIWIPWLTAMVCSRRSMRLMRQQFECELGGFRRRQTCLLDSWKPVSSCYWRVSVLSKRNVWFIMIELYWANHVNTIQTSETL